MTIEEQRYLDECRKVLDREQLDIVTMAMAYGLALSSIQQVVRSNKNAACMSEIVFALMDNVEQAVIDFLCENEFNRYQIKEIVEGIRAGLTIEQVKTFAVSDISASRMKKMRSQLAEQKKGTADSDVEVRDYMKGLMEIMESSIQHFKESNERFDTLTGLLKDHIVEEKNREIQDLYENLKYKDKKIQELQVKLSESQKRVEELETVSEEPQHPVPESPVEPQENSQGSGEHGPAEDEVLSLRKRMLHWFFGGKELTKDLLEKIMSADLSSEQLEEVRKCMESGLEDHDITRVIQNNPTPERMAKMREILILMKRRKAGE